MRRILYIALLMAGMISGFPGITGAEEKLPIRLEARALNRMIENQEKLLLINVSGYLSCMDTRIPNSVCLSCDDQWGRPDIFPDNKETKLVFYHASPAWDQDCRLVAEAQQQGFTRIYTLRGGLPAWRKAGYDTESVQRVPRTQGLAIKPGAVTAWIKSAHKPLAVDVRPAAAYQRQHIEGAINIPFSVLQLRYPDIPLGRTLLIIDEDGAMSFLAASYLSRKGFTGVVRLSGGMAAWRDYAGKALRK